MAIFVDLDDADVQAPLDRFRDVTRDSIQRDIDKFRELPQHAPEQPRTVNRAPCANVDHETPSLEELYSNLDIQPNLELPAAIRAFACYPIVIAVASHIDLNTLDSLARTCRPIHNALMQFHGALMRSTIHCVRESLASSSYAPFGYKPSSCARDMVSECRRCNMTVCRNCVVKQPATPALKGRHRRLCLECTKAPLTSLFVPPMDEHVVNKELAKHAMCTCATDGVWLCQDCGHSNNSDDSLYQRLWTWRLSYGEVIGGLGTGIGDGDRGMICGRQARCLGAKEREQEVDCDAEDRRTPSPASAASSTGSASPPSAAPSLAQLPASLESASTRLQLQAPAARRDPGYSRHQIEGVGGQLRNKLVRMVRVGASVPEWSDERSRRVILEKEIKGEARSWCGWCWRPIPGEKDKAALGICDV
ncbi:hypothetical protein TD95_004438 [Thielaviopsis punctulata]|uniref:Uncharacterized protein n=1 Tax=Thielaviopsis punctulata TaxID=72032 RepID=A0A0F4ZJB5_9PEZI|nr:hypothetical protein TD95_004438 [Thielaviopsis punctulata]